jgi:hypothetical protein
MDLATSSESMAGRSGGPCGTGPGQLSETEITALVERCPEPMRWAFEGWLRGVRHLDGDPIEECSR